MAGIALVVTLAGGGCTLPPPSETTTETSPPQVIAALARDPAEAARLLEARVDPVQQQSLLWALVAHDVARASQICPHLQGHALQEDCRHLTNRPHLFRGRPGTPQPVLPTVTVSVALEHPQETAIDAASAAAADCAAQPGADLCWLARAEALSRQPQAAAQAGAVCHQITASLWLEECHFRVADNRMVREPSRAYGEAAAFCLHAGALAGRCLERLHEIIGTEVPPTDAEPAAWTEVHTLWQQTQDFWQTRGELVMATRAAQEILAIAAATAVARSQNPGGGVFLQVFGEDAAPHIRAALAAGVAQALPSDDRPLAVRVAQVLDLQQTTPSPPVPRASWPRGPLWGARDLWLLSESASRDLPVVPYLRNGRRVRADTPEADAAIAVLEAAARWTHDPEALLAEGAQHPDAQVRWTALRLQRMQTIPLAAPAVSATPPPLGPPTALP